MGFISLRSNTTGQLNTAIGAGALLANTADQNTATGAGALLSNTTGTGNTADGAVVLFSNTGGNGNTATGNSALFTNTTGSQNTAIGAGALLSNTADANTATGHRALFNNTTGLQNTAIGASALRSNTTGGFNTAVGTGALVNNSTGDGNVALGAGAGANSTGGHNIALGTFAADAVTTANGVICIGTSGANVDDSCYIGNIWQQSGGSQAVYVNASGKLGAQVSSRRFKDEIKAMEETSEVIYRLKPVSFRYKPEIEPTRPVGFGLVAEDVEEISPDLVTHGADGQLSSVRYDAVSAMLLNEFLKEHRKVEELTKDFQAAVAQLTMQHLQLSQL